MPMKSNIDYLLTFLLFLAAVFILCYRFKREGLRVVLIVLFVVGCFVRLFVV